MGSEVTDRVQGEKFLPGMIEGLRSRQVEWLSMAELDISELNVRRREITADLDELAENLDKYGQYQPILVAPKGERYSIVVGQRRYLAAKQLGWDQISALILKQAPERIEATLLSLSENVQRRDLTPQDKADACSYLMEELGNVREVAEAIGVTPTTVRNWLGFAAVPDDIRALVQPRGLTVQQATRISQRVDDEQTALAIAKRVAETPIKADRDRVLESAAELPGRSADTIFKRAAEKEQQKRIVFILAESSAQAIERAAEDRESDENEIAMNATLQWLEDNKYLK